MSAVENIASSAGLEEASAWLEQFSIAQAAELARSGDFARAESLLSPLIGRAAPPVAALDLQARICAQQGRLFEAAECWRKALQSAPDHPAAQAGLAQLQRMQRRPA